MKNFKISLGSANRDKKPAKFIQNLNKQPQLAAARAIVNRIASGGRDTDRSLKSKESAGNSKVTGKAAKRVAKAAALEKTTKDAEKALELSSKNSGKDKPNPAGGPQASGTGPTKKVRGSGPS